MMNISQIKEFTESISGINPVGKSFTVGDFEVELVGFYKKDSRLNMLLLVYNEILRDLIEEYEAEADSLGAPAVMTVREEELRNMHADLEFPHIREIYIGNECFAVKSSQNSLLDNNIAENSLLLAEFIKNGWFSERFAHVSPHNLFIMTCNPKEPSAAVNINKEIRISFAAERKTAPLQIPLTLEINGNAQEFLLPCGNSIYIRKVQTFDLHEHTRKVFESEKIRAAFSPEELEERLRSIEKSNAEICPEGKCFLTIEYEVPENISLRIIPKATLDSPRGRSNGAFGVLMSATEEAGHEGYKVKCETISQPFDPDIESLEAEIFSYTVSTPIKDVIL